MPYKSSTERLQYLRDYRREHQKQAMSEGLCLECFKRPVVEGPQGGKRMCAYCRERARENDRRKRERRGPELNARAKERGKRLRSENRCHYCTTPITTAPKGPGPQFCPPCRERRLAKKRESWPDWNKRRRIEALEIYGSRCRDCGYTDIRVLEFHHSLFNGREVDGIRAQRTVARILREGHDPDLHLLCANCHRIRHLEAGISTA